MSSISGVERVIRAIGRWNPSDLAFIEQLEYTAQTSDEDSTLVCTAIFQRSDASDGSGPNDVSPRFRLRILFVGVRGLHIKDFGGPPTQIMGFDIVDISDRGWEGVTFSIEDYEDGLIGFYCKNIRIASVTPA